MKAFGYEITNAVGHTVRVWKDVEGDIMISIDNNESIIDKHVAIQMIRALEYCTGERDIDEQ